MSLKSVELMQLKSYDNVFGIGTSLTYVSNVIECVEKPLKVVECHWNFYNAGNNLFLEHCIAVSAMQTVHYIAICKKKCSILLK